MKYLRKFYESNEGFVLDTLEEELDKAIESENYERAAELRDLMKQLIQDNEEYKKKYSLDESVRIKRFKNFISEEINRKQFVTGALAATLGLGGLATGGAYLRDKSGAPTEQVTDVKKEIPNDFMINEELLTIGSDFWVTNKNKENFGKIEQRIVSFGKKFEYFDNTGELSATAKEKVLTLYTIIDVVDGTGNKLGRIEAEVIESFKNILDGQNVYSIYDSNNKLIGKSKADLIIKNNVDIYDDNDNLIATFHKPMVQFGDRWSCSIKSDNIDKRLLIFIPAYLSSKSSSSSSSSSKKK